ncbi:MAG: pncB [Parachlamydiales bacterium]|nr:pncB [Parachlamydiales bacterium]
MDQKKLELPLYHHSLALLTDLYQLTMVYGYWKAGIADRQAVFHLNFRKWPFQGGFAIAAGLETALRFIESLQFTPGDLGYLDGLSDYKGRKLFDDGFTDFLSGFSFSCDVDAMEEGSLVFPYEPLIRVKGPIWQAQLMETPLLNLINFQTLIATKSARICLAAQPDPVIEFGIRRAQGIDGAISASRAAFIGGCIATSDVLAGKLFDIPVRGTHAHSWVMAFDEEKLAFETFARTMPTNGVMLIDTYDSIEGVKNAIAVARSMKKNGFELSGVRLDSGDLARLSIEVRKILDDAGLFKTQIMASNELDEYLIRDLKQQGARIDVWGVGTNLVTAKDQSALDGVYKLSAIQDAKGQWQDRIKISEQTAKTTNPGIQQVRRYFDGQFYAGDAIYDEMLGIKDPCTAISPFDPNNQVHFKGEYDDLLKPVMRQGKLVYRLPSMLEIQSHTFSELKRLPVAMERFLNPQPYFAGMEKTYYQKKIDLIMQIRKKNQA